MLAYSNDMFSYGYLGVNDLKLQNDDVSFCDDVVSHTRIEFYIISCIN